MEQFDNLHVIVVLGQLGPCNTGRQLSYPQMEPPTADLYVSVASAVGIDVDAFGTPEHGKGPLPGLV